MRMPFGKYKGYEVDSLPPSYVRWLWDNVTLHDDLRAAVATRLGKPRDSQQPNPGYDDPRRRADPPPPPPRPGFFNGDVSIAHEILKLGYREAAKKYHPDAGGDTRKMMAVNATYEAMQKAFPAR